MSDDVAYGDTPPHRRPARSTKLIRVTTDAFPEVGTRTGAYLLEDVGDYIRLGAPNCSSFSDQCAKATDADWALKQWFGDDYEKVEVPLRLARGQFHPRIWRNGIDARGVLRREDLNDARPRAIAFHRIQSQLQEIFEVVTPRRCSAAAHGAAIEQTLTLCAREVEALFRNAYDANRGSRNPEHDISDWHELLALMKLDAWKAQLSYFPEWQWVQPFQNWSAHRAPFWWTANNKFKHDDAKRWLADLESVISAACAIRILLEAMFGPGIAELIPPTGLADIAITGRPIWDADEVYFPPLGEEPLQAVPAIP